MAYGLLLLRLVIGLTFAAHGAQKAFGWFGGPGPRGVAGFVGSLGFRPAPLWAWLLTLAELVGGPLFALGLLTPLASLALATDMIVAIMLIHRPRGFFNEQGGMEFPLTLLTVVIALVATGPGRFSLDRAIGWDDAVVGLAWAAGVLGLALVGAFFAISLGRGREIADLPA